MNIIRGNSKSFIKNESKKLFRTIAVSSLTAAGQE